MKMVFGEMIPGLNYRKRKGVYAIAFHHEKDQVLVVRNDTGHYFLPGGGMEGDESQVECLERELMEETGYRGTIGSYVGNAMRYFLTRKEEPLLSDAFFYQVELNEKVQEQSEHVTEWIDLEEASQLLFHEHHDWAVKKAIDM
ncbi:NUDIX domain-containing protein [Rossellomorea aquimaris]|uniref:NUDIX hydrolase n=1 Tax=Rossellomorea aquimaris TaxID=189382 RepID=UPI001CD1E824|nr:NUDIX domain-containing protein [Rossellomorea aquimaris]MCA1060161.1 NUDIX domain-containing protein [Rossellomorea aquimaris]